MRLIDADALLERMKKDPLFQLVERYGVSGVIDAEPTVEPKTGRWMFPDPPIHKPICSECRKPCIGLHAFAYELTDYCPNCGAKMEEETDG